METHATTNANDIRNIPPANVRQPRAERSALPMTPVSPCTNWTTINLNAAVTDAATTPGALTVSKLRRLDVGQGGTSVLVRMKYPVSGGTACTVRLFGFDGTHLDNNGVVEAISVALAKPQQLPDEAGALSTVFTPAGTDPQDQAGFGYTKAVRFDMLGNVEILALVTVAGAATSTIEARVI